MKTLTTIKLLICLLAIMIVVINKEDNQTTKLNYHNTVASKSIEDNEATNYYRISSIAVNESFGEEWKAVAPFIGFSRIQKK